MEWCGWEVINLSPEIGIGSTLIPPSFSCLVFTLCFSLYTIVFEFIKCLLASSVNHDFFRVLTFPKTYTHTHLILTSMLRRRIASMFGGFPEMRVHRITNNTLYIMQTLAHIQPQKQTSNNHICNYIDTATPLLTHMQTRKFTQHVCKFYWNIYTQSRSHIQPSIYTDIQTHKTYTSTYTIRIIYDRTLLHIHPYLQTFMQPSITKATQPTPHAYKPRYHSHNTTHLQDYFCKGSDIVQAFT